MGKSEQTIKMDDIGALVAHRFLGSLAVRISQLFFEVPGKGVGMRGRMRLVLEWDEGALGTDGKDGKGG